MRLAQAGMLLNMVLAVVKVLAGLIGHSYALIADGIESAADIFGSLIVWSGLRVARRSADTAYPFGYGKAEALAAAGPRSEARRASSSSSRAASSIVAPVKTVSIFSIRLSRVLRRPSRSREKKPERAGGGSVGI